MPDKTTQSLNIKAKSIVEAVIEAIPAPVFYKHQDGRYLGCNAEFEKFVGKTKTELLGKTVYELWDPELARIYDEADKALMKQGGRQIYEAQVTYADGSLRDVMFHKAVFNVEDEFSGLAGVMLDVTARNEAERLLRYTAETDALTGLYNRAFFYEQFPKILSQAASDSSGLTLLALDLDHLKPVNDQYGHKMGDQLLMHTARRLNNAVREDDLVARVGGDEFLILLKNIDSEADARKIADSILRHINSSPIEIAGELINISISIGMLYDIPVQHSIDDIIHLADNALYRAKQIRNAVSD